MGWGVTVTGPRVDRPTSSGSSGSERMGDAESHSDTATGENDRRHDHEEDQTDQRHDTAFSRRFFFRFRSRMRFRHSPRDGRSSRSRMNRAYWFEW